MDNVEYHYPKEPIFNEYQNADDYKESYFYDYYDGNIEWEKSVIHFMSLLNVIIMVSI